MHGLTGAAALPARRRSPRSGRPVAAPPVGDDAVDVAPETARPAARRRRHLGEGHPFAGVMVMVSPPMTMLPPMSPPPPRAMGTIWPFWFGMKSSRPRSPTV